MQLATVKERLETVKAGSTRGLNQVGGAGGAFSFAGAGSRIAKPLRGGGGDEPAGNPAVQSIQQNEGAATSKRTSWFFNKS